MQQSSQKMNTNLKFLLSITLVSSLGIRCKKESTTPIFKQNTIVAATSGNKGYVICNKKQLEKPNKQYNKKEKKTNTNKLNLSELGSNDIREVRNNAVFKTDTKNQTFIDNNGDHVYIERKRISKQYNFAILERRKNINEIIPVATAKGRSQEEMIGIARDQKWPDDVINKIESVDY